MIEHDGAVFLLSIAVLLGGARALGEIARLLGLPTVVGELAAGLLLGKTILARASAGAYAFLFPEAGPARAMLGGFTTLAVVLLVVLAGLEIDLELVRRRGRTAVAVSTLGILAPLAGGVALGLSLDAGFVAQPGRRALFALLLGVTLSISAMPVVKTTLRDLGLFKTELGLLVTTAAMLDDLLGWIGFGALVGNMSAHHFAHAARTLAFGTAFVAACLLVGRRAAHVALARIDENADGAPGRVLSLLIVAAVLGATAMQAIGLHTALGGFVVGVTVADSMRLRERTRQTIHQFVTNVFAPVFFATAALRVDFVANFSPLLCLGVFAIATLAKLVGCAVGARVAGLSPREAAAVGFGLSARGAMTIILALLARDAGLVEDRVFVALVTAAIATSLVSGPAMSRVLYRAPKGGGEDAAALVLSGAFVPKLSATTSARAIEELGRALQPVLGELVETALIAVLEREIVAPTGLGDGVAIPHAAVEGLTRPTVALGLAPRGIDFSAPDGRPAKIVFLLLLPPKALETEVRVLAALARSVFDDAARDALLRATSAESAARCLDEHGRRIARATRAPRMSSLTDL